MSVKRYVALLWMALFLVLSVTPTAVQAHAGLMGSQPKDNEVLQANPGQISMRFTEVLEPDLVAIHLYNWKGEEVQLEAPTLQPGDASQVNAKLPDLPEGTYTAIVSVVSEDGHPVEERLTFSIGQKSASVVDPTAQKSDSSYLIVYRYLTQGILLLGGGLYLLAWRGERYGLPSFGKLLGIMRQIGWGLAIIGLVFLWFLYDESLAAVSLTDALWQGSWSVLMQSSFAMMLLVSLGLLILLAIPGMVSGWYVILWLALLCTQAFGGHAWGISPVWLSLLLRVLHVLTVSLWMGALFYLLLTYRQAERGNEGFKAFFLRTVAVASLLAVLTGIAMLGIQTNVIAIFQSSLTWSYLFYGKVAAVCVMLVIAFWQTKNWRQKNALRPLLLRWEVALGIVAILAGMWMSQTQYPTTVDSSTTDSATTVIHQHQH
ncbi:copper resistance CopC/CopD family protein [Brevibacillus centrosporus]|uniref:Copper transport protein n=1 Tax=Brevibacillus centrosporus TaxID=54910 RepID=A0A1I4BFM2_9BACL|nr:copper resistance protein CopC [Brevibacillus centrosporus]SFK67594.1 copper transport protein [Brevibacillus centrosporus]